jgi:hypothetical protein
MKKVVYLALLVLIVAHQDFWWWHTHEPLVFGFIPIGLAWHAGISISAGLLGLLAVRFCWPHELDADEAAPAARGGEGAAT